MKDILLFYSHILAVMINIAYFWKKYYYLKKKQHCFLNQSIAELSSLGSKSHQKIFSDFPTGILLKDFCDG